MSKRFDLITQQLLGKDLNDCSAEELQRLTEQYPYFAPAQFALLKKLKQTDSPAYKTQVQKAILYYHNPFLFDVFMNEENYDVHFDVAAPDIETTEGDSIAAEPEVLIDEQVIEEPSEQVEEIETTSDPATTTIDEIPTVSENDSLVETEDQTEVVHEQQPTEDEQIAAEIVSRTEAEEVQEAVPEKEIELPKLEIVDEKVDEKALAFEPYHTVDYFASQGIKLSQEEATKDKFGKQLKSFTEWLKTMKKIPAAEQQSTTITGTDKKVENMAAHSVEKSEIVTETMAEVWAKQGNREKALEIYQQLSLLNPSKRAYFAAKIDSLK